MLASPSEIDSIAFSREDIIRLLTHIIGCELASMRKSNLDWSELHQWDRETVISSGGCGADSFESLTLATRCLHFFQAFTADKPPVLGNTSRLADWAAALMGATTQFDKLGFFSSGSAGQAKAIVHQSAHLLKECSTLKPYFSNYKRIVSLVPCHHLYGFIFTILLPRVLGLTCFQAQAFAPIQLSGLLREGDLVIGFPDYYALWKAYAVELPPNIGVVTSTSFCSEKLKEDLASAGVDAIYDIYGSTETSGIGIKVWPEPSYKLLEYWSIDEGTHSLSSAVLNAQKPFSLMDKLKLIRPGYFNIEGRIDNCVQVGGQNINLDEVKSILLRSPYVSQCEVRKMLGHEVNRLKAFIVLNDSYEEKSEVISALRAWIDNNLQTLQRPKYLSFGENLPKNHLGKSCDWDVSL